MTQGLAGKVALVTGAAGVLGAATARALAAAGCRVALIDLTEDKLTALAEDIGGAAIACDVSNFEAVKAAHAKVADALGEVAILVNNAGILSNNKIEATSAEEWRRVIGVNLDGAFYLTQCCLPAMKAAGWGRIVNVCSLASKTGGLTAGTAYSTSKGGLTALTFSVARESAAHGVTVNGIAPAYIKTPMVSEQLNEDQRRELLRSIPVGRFVEAEEVAELIAYLASPKAGFITGEIVDINGGLLFD